MLYSCKYCGKVHRYGQQCHTKPARHKQRTEQTDIRSTSRWTQKSIEIRKRDGYLCRVCLGKGIIKLATGVHHIVPLEEDPTMAFEDDWLVSLCDGDHKKADAGVLSRGELHQLASQKLPPLPAAPCRG